MILDVCCVFLFLKRYFSDFCRWFLYIIYFASYYEHGYPYDYHLNFLFWFLYDRCVIFYY